jgi:hypothetical protein
LQTRGLPRPAADEQAHYILTRLCLRPTRHVSAVALIASS